MSARTFRFTILALQRQAARELTALLSELDLTPSQAEVVGVVGMYGPLSVREVGDLLICESGSPSRLVQTLVTRGLLARAVSSTDRRASFLTLTREGRDVLERVEAVEGRYDAQVADRLAGVDVASLTRTLRAGVTDELLAGALDRRFPGSPPSTSPAATA